MNNQLDSEFQDNSQADEMLPEYEFNYCKARSNRFASRTASKGKIMLLKCILFKLSCSLEKNCK